MFKKNKDKKIEVKLTSFDKMVTRIVYEEEEQFNLADIIIDNKALCANFEKIEVDSANSIIKFLTGVVYALEGVIKPVGEKTFIFIPKSELEDESIDNYLGKIN